MSKTDLNNYLTSTETEKLTGIPHSSMLKFLKEDRIKGRLADGSVWIIDKEDLLDFIVNRYKGRVKVSERKTHNINSIIYEKIDHLSRLMKMYTKTKNSLLLKKQQSLESNYEAKDTLSHQSNVIAKDDLEMIINSLDGLFINDFYSDKNELTHILKMLDNLCEKEIESKGIK